MTSIAFHTVSRHGAQWLECTGLSALPWLLHAFGTRQGGISRNNSPHPRGPGSARGPNPPAGDDQQLFCQAVGAERFALASLRQIHSADTYQLDFSGGRPEYRPFTSLASTPRDSGSPPGDGLVTDHAGVLLSVRTADCLPILLADTQRRVVAAVHAGWRGVLERIVEKTARQMQRLLGTRPEDLHVGIGPSIRACCYEVGSDVRDAFRTRFPAEDALFFKPLPLDRAGPSGPSPLPRQQPTREQGEHGERYCLDLVAVARRQLEGAGVPPSNVAVAEFCTACRSDLFFSYRREGSRTGRMMTVIGIRP